MSIQPLYSTKLQKPLWLSASSSNQISQSRRLENFSTSISFDIGRRWHLKPNGVANGGIKAREYKRGLGVASAVQSESPAAVYEERWILQPAGDGDWRHIGSKVALPDAFEIASNDAVIVGRVSEKADWVIPVATVSGVHARLEKKAGGLLVTDLDSTNGTFVDEKRLIPGVPVAAPLGSYITFGDTNLAIFRLSKTRNLKPTSIPDEPEPQPVTVSSTESSEEAT